MATCVVATAFGGPEVLSLVDVDLEAPGPGEVAVEVRAAGTNPIDVKLFSGSYGIDASQLPLRLGFELSGVVTAVGSGAEGPGGPLTPGDEVIGFRVPGAYASHVVVPGFVLMPKPAALSFEQAGGLMLTGVTAVHAVTVTGVGAGDTVVVHGAAGGVGRMVVPLAVAAGARVIATVNETSHSDLRALGAEPVAYGDGLLERITDLAPDGVDVALDMVGTDEALDVSVALVADRGRIATIAGIPRGFELGIRVLGGAPGADHGVEIRDAARMDLVRLVEEGRLTVRVAHTYPLAEAAAALTELASGHTHGKIILVP